MEAPIYVTVSTFTRIFAWLCLVSSHAVSQNLHVKKHARTPQVYVRCGLAPKNTCKYMFSSHNYMRPLRARSDCGERASIVPQGHRQPGLPSRKRARVRSTRDLW
jgi:hypothetical protein